jgi:hypothetical protein
MIFLKPSYTNDDSLFTFIYIRVFLQVVIIIVFITNTLNLFQRQVQKSEILLYKKIIFLVSIPIEEISIK